MKVNRKPVEFDWDKGNIGKNWRKHKVKDRECEEIFFDPNKQEYPDPEHSKKELRKIIVGKTKKGRILFIVYTIRNRAVRVISARNLSKRKEVSLYEKAT